MSSLKLSASTPKSILQEINRLKKSLPDQQVDNNLTLMRFNNSSDCSFYLELYQNIEEWGVQNFYWNKILKTQNEKIANDSQLNEKEQSLSKEDLRKQYKKGCILRQISDINFLNLKSLYITQCELQSIEPLSWINMEKLSCLILQFNEINTIKSLSKCVFKHLNTVNLSYNSFPKVQLNYLNRTKMNKKKQKKGYLWFYQPQNVENQDKCTDLSTLAKLELQQLKNIYTIFDQDINKKVMKSIKQKFQILNLF